MENPKKRWLILVIAVVACLAGVLYGYCTAIIAGALIAMAPQFSLTVFAKEILATSILVGAFVGASFSGILTNRWGRKFAISYTAAGCLFFTVASMITHHLTYLVLARLGLGICIGIFSMAVPLYVAEISPPRYRGALVSVFQFAVTIGILISYITGFIFQANNNWQMMLGIALFPAAVLLMSMFFLPESPRWLVLQKKFQEAREVFSNFYAPEAIEQHIVMVSQSARPKGNWRELSRKPAISVLLLSIGIFVLQNISGIDGILYYAPEIFAAVGVESKTGMMFATIILGLVNVLATLVAVFFVDILGRRWLLLTGILLMSMSLLVLVFSLYILPVGIMAGWMTLICLCLFIATFAMSLGPIPFVLMSEIFPASIRDIGMSFSVAASWLSNIVVTISYLTLIEVVGKVNLFLLYCIICMIGFYFVWRFVPETKQLSLERIESDIYAGKKLRDIGKV